MSQPVKKTPKAQSKKSEPPKKAESKKPAEPQLSVEAKNKKKIAEIRKVVGDSFSDGEIIILLKENRDDVAAVINRIYDETNSPQQWSTVTSKPPKKQGGSASSQAQPANKTQEKESTRTVVVNRTTNESSNQRVRVPPTNKKTQEIKKAEDLETDSLPRVTQTKPQIPNYSSTSSTPSSSSSTPISSTSTTASSSQSQTSSYSCWQQPLQLRLLSQEDATQSLSENSSQLKPSSSSASGKTGSLSYAQNPSEWPTAGETYSNSNNKYPRTENTVNGHSPSQDSDSVQSDQYRTSASSQSVQPPQGQGRGKGYPQQKGGLKEPLDDFPPLPHQQKRTPATNPSVSIVNGTAPGIGAPSTSQPKQQIAPKGPPTSTPKQYPKQSDNAWGDRESGDVSPIGGTNQPSLQEKESFSHLNAQSASQIQSSVVGSAVPSQLNTNSPSLSPSPSPSPSSTAAYQYPYQNHYYDQNENYTESSDIGVASGPPHSSSSAASMGNIAQGYVSQYTPEEIAQLARQIEAMNLDPKQQELYRYLLQYNGLAPRGYVDPRHAYQAQVPSSHMYYDSAGYAYPSRYSSLMSEHPYSQQNPFLEQSHQISEPEHDPEQTTATHPGYPAYSTFQGYGYSQHQPQYMGYYQNQDLQNSFYSAPENLQQQYLVRMHQNSTSSQYLRAQQQELMKNQQYSMYSTERHSQTLAEEDQKNSKAALTYAYQQQQLYNSQRSGYSRSPDPYQ